MDNVFISSGAYQNLQDPDKGQSLYVVIWIVDNSVGMISVVIV